MLRSVSINRQQRSSAHRWRGWDTGQPEEIAREQSKFKPTVLSELLRKVLSPWMIVPHQHFCIPMTGDLC